MFRYVTPMGVLRKVQGNGKIIWVKRKSRLLMSFWYAACMYEIWGIV